MSSSSRRRTRATSSGRFRLELLEQRRKLWPSAERLTETGDQLEERRLEAIGCLPLRVDERLTLLTRVVELLLALRERATQLPELKVQVVGDPLGCVGDLLRAPHILLERDPLIDRVCDRTIRLGEVRRGLHEP